MPRVESRLLTGLRTLPADQQAPASEPDVGGVECDLSAMRLFHELSSAPATDGVSC